jgi:hypothetical protein
MSCLLNFMFSGHRWFDLVSGNEVGVGMYSRHGQWGSNTMAKNEEKQFAVKVSEQRTKNIKKPMKSSGPSQVPMQKKKRQGGSSSQEKGFSGYEGDLAIYAKQFLLPSDVPAPKVCPSNYPSQVCSRRIHRVLDVSSATAAYANGFTVVMNPDLYLPGFITSKGTVVAPTVAGIVGIEGRLSSNPKSVAGDMENTPLTVTDSTGEKKHLKIHGIADSAALIMHGLDLTPGAHTIKETIHLRAGAPCTFEVWTKVAGAAWAKLAGLSTTIAVNESLQFTATTAANTDAIAFLRAGSTVNCDFDLNMVLLTSQVTGTSSESFSPAFEQFVIDSKVVHGRVISMSVLASNTSPALANGGNINAGRVPRNFNPFINIASEMSALPPNRRHQGLAADGAYVTWMPAQYDEYEIDSVTNKVNQLKEADYLLVEVSGWNPPAGSTASFRLQFDWIVEFYTPNQLFEKIVTPAYTPEFSALYNVLLNLDAATCNPGHFDQLKSLLASGIHGISTGLEFYGQHKELIHSVLSVLSTLL